jgi:hypothetical protein
MYDIWFWISLFWQYWGLNLESYAC